MPTWVNDRVKPFFLRLLLQLVSHLLALILELPHHLLDAMRVVVAVEDRWNLPLARVDEIVHVSSKLAHHAAGKADGNRLRRLLKVVEVAPIGRDGTPSGYAPQVRLERRVAACAGQPRDEEVETRRVDVQAQVQGAYRSVLADGPFERLQPVGRLEPELVGVAPTLQLLGGHP